MIIMVIVLAIILLAILEFKWADWSMKRIRYKGSCDKLLAEPGETVCWTAQVDNLSKFLLVFVRLWETFPRNAKPIADAKWLDARYKESVSLWNADERMSLLPRRRCVRSVRICFDRRGYYEIGKTRMSTGDLLGLKEQSTIFPGENIVIIPKETANRVVVEALGGFLGDMSVRRFILEDPVLTIGYRDYTGREPMKAISWTQTARTGSLMVKEYDHTAELNAMVLLNVEGANEEQFEECLRTTRTVCQILEQKKIPYSLRTNGNLPGPVGKIFTLAEGLGETHLNTILYGLGRADDTCFYSLNYLVSQILQIRRNNETYILITPPLSEKNAAPLRKLQSASGGAVCVLECHEEVEE